MLTFISCTTGFICNRMSTSAAVESEDAIDEQNDEPSVPSQDDPLVIVLDPGHGGENRGAEHNGYTEKIINMTVARAMKEELEKYDGVTVYLTHESAEVDLSLKERAEFAVEKGADFLYCLHFNMSENHNFFGAEVWISAFDQYYAKGYAFGTLEMELLSEMGLYSRGIKTRLNDSGDDYYGIIRESRKLGLDCVLIEHCHLDHAQDQLILQQEEQLKKFGRLDAAAAARYFRLSSAALGVNYQDYSVPEVAIPLTPVAPDLTPPDLCELTLDSLDEETGAASFTLKAEDYDSRLLYYGLSLDGGLNYMELEPFPENETEISFTAALPTDRNLLVCASVYNAYDRAAKSKWIEITALAEMVEDEAAAPNSTNEYTEVSPDEFIRELGDEPNAPVQAFDIYQIGIIVVGSLLVLVMLILISRLILLRRIRRRQE